MCFNCREKGHALDDCPDTKKDKRICYTCGSKDHTSRRCTETYIDNKYAFATCFVCKEKGHLSGDCPTNEKGLYVNRGSCKKCGSVRHLARNCRETDQELLKEIESAPKPAKKKVKVVKM